MRLGGLVLAGGRSRRFGSDKALATLGGRPLLTWSLAALAPLCELTAVSARGASGAESLARSLGAAVVLDEADHAEGPLAGIAAGLAWATAAGLESLVSLPCDTPLVGEDELRALLAALGKAPAAFAVTDHGPQSLTAIWRVGLAGQIAQRLIGGAHPPVWALMAELGAQPVRFERAEPFQNVNTSGDLAALEASLAG